MLSAHGVSPAVRSAAAGRRLATIDATCPLVTKVHAETRRYAAEGYTVVLIGHEGTRRSSARTARTGRSPHRRHGRGGPRRSRCPIPTGSRTSRRRRCRWTRRRRSSPCSRRGFPQRARPGARNLLRDDQRQAAVKELAAAVDLLLVIGSQNSSNSKRLVEVARAAGCRVAPDRRRDRDRRAVAGRARDGRRHRRGSAPERLVGRVCDWFRARGVTDIRPFGSLVEDVFFRLPVEIRRATITAA